MSFAQFRYYFRRVISENHVFILIANIVNGVKLHDI